MDRPLLNILVVDDDEDDVVLIGRSLSEVRSTQFRVHWAPTYEEGLSSLCKGGFDACLLDYFLGARNGLELLQESVRRGCEVPTIMLTSRGNYGVDTEALRSGAADYLVKDQITADLLDRAIRYSIPIDITRMKQVFINLIMNAIQASPPGQTVSIRMGTKDKRFILDVTDCGCGIPPEKRREVFSPFFTTKREGTGLGLSIVKRIVEAHDGFVEIIDNSSTGITFRVAIPMDQ